MTGNKFEALPSTAMNVGATTSRMEDLGALPMSGVAFFCRPWMNCPFGPQARVQIPAHGLESAAIQQGDFGKLAYAEAGRFSSAHVSAP